MTGGFGQATVRPLPDILRTRADKQPDDVAYVFLGDGEQPTESVTYAALNGAALGIAQVLRAGGLLGGNAVMLFAPGLDFVKALLGCQYAGVAGAPVKVPQRRTGLRRIRAVADNAGTTTVVTSAAVRRALTEQFPEAPELSGLRWITIDEHDPAAGTDGLPLPDPDRIALLQYTSGSTGDPRGVMVTHRNFWHNAAELDELWPCGTDGRVVSWLPLFHDMGLLFGVVLPLWAGIPVFQMAPDAFLRRPMRWWEAVSRFRGTHTAAPNFAYAMCLEQAVPQSLDLSSLRVAVNGAEPVRAETLRRFADTFAPYGLREQALCPGYGLAENTLKVSGSRPDRPAMVLHVTAADLAGGRVVTVAEDAAGAVALAGSGEPAPGTHVRIVDPRTRTECQPDEVGEIWVNGPCVGRGYWADPQRSAEVFSGRLAGSLSPDYLRTGDLGFRHDGQLFIVGRLKDVIIHRGRNHYPQDIEQTVEATCGDLHPSSVVAFGVDDGAEEQLVVVMEANGRILRQRPAPEIRAAVSATVEDRHGLPVREVVLIKRGTLPRTSSGKVRRSGCRDAFLAGTLTLAAGTGA